LCILGKWLTFNCNRRLLPLCLNRIHKTYIRILHILNAQFQSPMTSGFSNYQGGAVQNVETVNQCQFPVHGNSENFQTYPIQYPSQSNYGQTTVYYSNVPTSTPQMASQLCRELHVHLHISHHGNRLCWIMHLNVGKLNYLIRSPLLLLRLTYLGHRRVHVNSENFQTYPIQYPSQSNYGQTTVYYSNVPTSTPQMGLVYNSNQGTL
jgi:hypothetical protein